MSQGQKSLAFFVDLASAYNTVLLQGDKVPRQSTW